jgi:hypothetical protein
VQKRLNRQSRMEANKVFYEFLIVTVPAVVLYFVGWGYLYYLLGAFNIGISEVHIDLPTVFIYSMPVVQNALQRYVYYLVFIFILLPILVLLFHSKQEPAQKKKIKQTLAKAATAIRDLSIWIKLAIVLLILVLAALAMVPVIGRAAADAADRIWDGGGSSVLAFPQLDTAKLAQLTLPPTSSPATPAQSDWQSKWTEQFKACSMAEALRLIYADDSAYYLLCTNGPKSRQGIVFEVRRKEGLVSIRFPTRR